MWKTVFGKLFNWFFFLLFAAMAAFTCLSLMIGVSDQLGEHEVRFVEETFTKKGLHSGLTYYVHLSTGEELRIFKRDFLTLEKGDPFTTAFSTLTVKEFGLFISFFLLFFISFLMLAYLFAGRLFREKAWFEKIDSSKKKWIKVVLFPFKDKSEVWKRVTIISFIFALSLLLLMGMKSGLHKIIPFGKTEVMATISDAERTRIETPRTLRFRYKITYEYEDQFGNEYKTKKDVSRATYKRYQDQSSIPIVYRNRVPYDSYIAQQTMHEYVSAVLHYSFLKYVLALILIKYLGRKYKEKWGMPFNRYLQKKGNR